MREIKFRAWHKANDRMLDWASLKSYLVMPGTDGSLIWMQFTGLKGKNGKEIYEGDIVKQAGDEDGGWVSIMLVECDAPNGGFNLRDKGEYVELFHQSLEVIGNIWENQGLLK